MKTMNTQQNHENSLIISDNAAKKILQVSEKSGKNSQFFRVTILGGGCSGFKYALEFDDTQREGDVVFEKNGAKVVTDDMSLQYLAGAEIDYVEDMMSSAFKIKNPNAASGCGCGKSFGV